MPNHDRVRVWVLSLSENWNQNRNLNLNLTLNRRHEWGFCDFAQKLALKMCESALKYKARNSKEAPKRRKCLAKVWQRKRLSEVVNVSLLCSIGCRLQGNIQIALSFIDSFIVCSSSPTSSSFSPFFLVFVVQLQLQPLALLCNRTKVPQIPILIQLAIGRIESRAHLALGG